MAQSVALSSSQYCQRDVSLKESNKSKNYKKTSVYDGALEDQVIKLLSTYDEGKKKLCEKILLATKKSQKALADQVKEHAGATSDASDAHTSVKEIQNFFLLIYKFLSEHKEGENKMMLSQVINAQGKEKMLGSVTRCMKKSVDTMQTKLDKADSKRKGFTGVIIGVAMGAVMLVGLVASYFTGGASLEASAEADTALEATGDAAEGANDALASSQEALDTLTTGAEEGASNTEQSIQEADNLANKAEESAETEGQAAENGLTKGTSKLSQLVSTAKTQGLRAAGSAYLSGVGATAALGAVGAGAMTSTTMLNMSSSSYTNAVQEATSFEQGDITIDSSAQESLQTDLKAGMQNAQNDTSQLESDDAQIQNTLQKEFSVNTIGSFNA